MEADFSGYATKAGLRCSDGRTITAEAFKHMDGKKVPLVWQHGHDKVENVLGHVMLEARDDGMYCKGYFNATTKGQTAKALVEHDDIKNLSIWANNLKENVISGGKQVVHGVIREVSLVLSGANPGAMIDQVRIAHSEDDIETLDDQAIIFTDEEIAHGEAPSAEDKVTPSAAEADGGEDKSKKTEEQLAHDAAGAVDETVQDVLNTLDEKQKQVLEFLVDTAFEEGATSTTAQHSDKGDGTDEKIDNNDSTKNNEGDLTHQEGTDDMSGGRNVFEQGKETEKTNSGPSLSHSDMKGIIEDMQKEGSLKSALEKYVIEHSITDIDVLFPDAKLVTSGPELIARRTEWVAGVLGGAKSTPFARIKSLAADITADEARAKGYVKGNLKKEEIVRLLKRVTTPTTIYKKQKLDRDDIVDIVDLDVVAWLKGEMRLMLEEELARAILIGDGREPDDEDKINEDNLRPIAWDDEMYSHSISVPANVTPDAIVETLIRARKFYKGTGTPSFYTTDDVLTDMLLIKNKIGDRVYKTIEELKATLRVSDVIVVEVMESTPDLLGILVNIGDYTIGADRGGAVSMFDDFDIDYNQLKYLIETRVSGALTKPKSAVVVKRVTGTTVVPTVPTFNEETNTLTIPTVTGVTYYDVTSTTGDGTVLTPGTHVITQTTDVEARANNTYSFAHNTDNDWTFAYTD